MYCQGPHEYWIIFFYSAFIFLPPYRRISFRAQSQFAHLHCRFHRIRILIDKKNFCSILDTGESRNSQLSGEVHTPVNLRHSWASQGTKTTLNEGNIHEGLQYLALYRQRGCVPFRRERKGHEWTTLSLFSIMVSQYRCQRRLQNFWIRSGNGSRRRTSGTSSPHATASFIPTPSCSLSAGTSFLSAN